MTWKQLKEILASGRHYYDPELLEQSPLGLKRYAGIARDFRHKNGGYLVGRRRTLDTVTGTAITGRMGAGAPGEVTRTHPVSIEPCLIDASAPPTLYGQAVLIDATTQGVRPFAAGDQALTDAFGVTVRPFPLQANTATPTLNSGTPPTSGVIDVLRRGYIAIGFNASGSAPVKGGQVYVWTAATSGAHIQGGWETADPTTNGCKIGLAPVTIYQGGWDANNVGELQFHV